VKVLVVMGVSGVGKTTIGRNLAERLGALFVEGDAYHPTANVEKLRRGEPLTDEDRWPWLEAIAADLHRWSEASQPVVIACSALRRAYREVLRRSCPGGEGVRFAHLRGPAPLVRARLEARAGHYMPATLLDSQLALLEPPDDDEGAVTVGVEEEPEAIVERLLGALARSGSTAAGSALPAPSRSCSSPSRPSDP
jgi:carbohydrate kinase (thermoresistant glucokinase family)